MCCTIATALFLVRQPLVRAPNLRQCLQTHLQVRGSKRLHCHADLCTVSRCRTRGESEDHTSKPKKKKKRSSISFVPREQPLSDTQTGTLGSFTTAVRFTTGFYHHTPWSTHASAAEGSRKDRPCNEITVSDPKQIPVFQV